MTQLLERTDQATVYHDRTWEQFKHIQKGLEGFPSVRLSYYNGTIEILMPGENHEFFKTIIGFLLELFLMQRGVEFIPAGSMTQEKAGTASAQADESYWITQKKAVSDLSVEVIFTNRVNKLERYKVLGVSEVWFWEDGVFTLLHLRYGYEQVRRSELPELRDLDINLLARCVLMAETSRIEAYNEFRRGIAK